MPDLPALKPREVISALERAGFYRIRQKGSHIQLRKGHLLVTVPFHGVDLSPGTLRSILRQARMSPEDLRRFL
ncbi:MAG: type II toxin-antitoxin system HicA family toxin [Chloroflexi bacterium]|nr:type II toxin-antitoxin system HicA family toxin [Chloroflexota bacterium]